MKQQRMEVINGSSVWWVEEFSKGKQRLGADDTEQEKSASVRLELFNVHGQSPPRERKNMHQQYYIDFNFGGHVSKGEVLRMLPLDL